MMIKQSAVKQFSRHKNFSINFNSDKQYTQENQSLKEAATTIRI